jgi:hypothetical protein
MRTRCSERSALIALLSASALSAGCARQPPPPPPQPPPAPLTEWPGGLSPPLKITDQLTLRIPLGYQRSAIDRGAAAVPSTPGSFAHQEARFDFFLPGFTGYTPRNYRNVIDPAKVEVVYLHAGNPHEAEADAPGEYPPNMLKRALAGSLDPNDHRDQYGLRCWRGREPSPRLTCYGRRDAAGEDILLTTLEPPYPADSFPQLQARYFSRRYGGVRIEWRTHVDNLPRWREIDARIWKFIEAWRVASVAPGSAPGQ